MDHEISKRGASCLPIPLTRTNADGEVYQRDAVVDEQIQEAIKLGAEALRRRSRITDKDSSEFLKEEALVYLIRHNHCAGNRQMVEALSESLLSRCAKLINSKLMSLKSSLKEDGYAEVVKELFVRILNLECDRGDFLQVRFWIYLERLTVQVFREQHKQQTIQRDAIRLTSLPGYDEEEGDQFKSKGGLSHHNTFTPPTFDTEVIDRILINKALSRLNGRFRCVYLLRYYWGWPIEDQDPSVQTISRHFNKTPRTIRNWLRNAEQKLKACREETKDEKARKADEA